MSAAEIPYDTIGVVINEFERRVASHRGHTLSVGGVGSLELTAPRLVGGATCIAGDLFRRATDGIALKRFACGDQTGIVLAVATGNDKDEASAFAATAASVAVLEAFQEPLISEADLVPALRRACLDAHDSIQTLSHHPIQDGAWYSVMGRRNSLRGIGTSLTALAVRPQRAFGVHVGDGRAFLRRGPQTRKLTIEHTLANHAAYRERQQAGEISVEGAQHIALKILGVVEEPPTPDVFRCDLLPGDQLLVGNTTLSTELASNIDSDPPQLPSPGSPCRETTWGGTEPFHQRLARRMRESIPLSAAVVVVSVE